MTNWIPAFAGMTSFLVLYAVFIYVRLNNYSPELTGIGKYSGEMAEWLAAQGHEVRVVVA